MTSSLDFSGGDYGADYVVPGSHISFGTWKYPGGYNDRILSASAFSQLVDASPVDGGGSVSSTLGWGGDASPSEIGFCFIDDTQSGFSVLLTGGNVSIRKEVDGEGGDTISAGVPHGLDSEGEDADVSVTHGSDGSISVLVKGVEVTTGIYTDIMEGLRAGAQNYNANSAHSFLNLTVASLSPEPTIVSVNDGDPVIAGAAGYALIENMDAVSLSIGGIATTSFVAIGANEYSFALHFFQNGSVYPEFDIVEAVAIGELDESASLNVELSLPAGWTETLVTSLSADPSSIASAVTGVTIKVGNKFYSKDSDITLFSDTTFSGAAAGTVTVWNRDVDTDIMTAIKVINGAVVSGGAGFIGFIEPIGFFS